MTTQTTPRGAALLPADSAGSSAVVAVGPHGGHLTVTERLVYGTPAAVGLGGAAALFGFGPSALLAGALAGGFAYWLAPELAAVRAERRAVRRGERPPGGLARRFAAAALMSEEEAMAHQAATVVDASLAPARPRLSLLARRPAQETTPPPPIPGPTTPDDDEEDTVVREEVAEDEEAVVIAGRHPLFIADSFRPSIDGLCGQCVNIVGMRRRGKSVLMRVLAEEIGRYTVPMIFFDTENEYQSLAQQKFLSRGVVVGSPDGERDAYEGVRYHVIRDDDEAATRAFGRAILEGNLQVLVDLKSYEDNAAAILMARLVRAMDEWEQERPTGERIPIFAFLDEAPHWFPQGGDETPLTQRSKAAVMSAFFDIIVRRGGKRGWGLVAAYQKRAEVDNRLLQAPYQFVFGQSEPPDLERCKKLGLDPDVVKTLPQGHAFVFCPERTTPLRIHVRMSRSIHLGKTPTMDDLTAHQERGALQQPVTSILTRLAGGRGVQGGTPATNTPAVAPPPARPAVASQLHTLPEQHGVPATWNGSFTRPGPLSGDVRGDTEQPDRLVVAEEKDVQYLVRRPRDDGRGTAGPAVPRRATPQARFLSPADGRATMPALPVKPQSPGVRDGVPLPAGPPRAAETLLVCGREVSQAVADELKRAPILWAALEEWDEGARSCRKLARALNARHLTVHHQPYTCNKDKAAVLIAQLRFLHLISEAEVQDDDDSASEEEKE